MKRFTGLWVTVGLGLLVACSSGASDDNSLGEQGSSGSAASGGAEAPNASGGAPEENGGGSSESGGSSNEGGSAQASGGAGHALPGQPLLTEMRSFIFGHSLLLHVTDQPGTADETTVPHWISLFATDAGYSYAADGQYGFLPQHAQLPPQPQWGFERVPGSWALDAGQSFADADFNNVLITAGNFIQYQPPNVPYDGDNPNNHTPLGETLKIIDWLEEQEPGINIYIYENWPDMAPTIGSFPPNAGELAAYYSYTLGEFHQWWLDYEDGLKSARPDTNLRMLPVGPILAHVLTRAPFNEIPTTTLYEDDAPHGRPSLYFIAALVTYMGTYGVPPTDSFIPPASIHSALRDNLSELYDVVRAQLALFEETRGDGQ